MNWHHTILGMVENTRLSGTMMRRGHAMAKGYKENIGEERAREIHMLCLLLNTLFLEWNYRNTYDKKPKDIYKKLTGFLRTGTWTEYDKNALVEFTGLNATIDNLLTGVVINNNPFYPEMMDNLRRIFPDFPNDFTTLVESRIKEIRKQYHSIVSFQTQAAGATTWGDRPAPSS